MAEQSAKSFLNLVERSGIVADQPLKAALSRLAQEQSGQKVNSQTLANYLVDSGLLTNWHVEKIKSGKFKGFFLGKFKLLGHLGTGGMSSVYLAEHSISQKKRAIKVLPRKRVSDKSYLDRFYLEGRAAAALNHPNVVRIYDICNDAETHYMVMEHVKGRDLYETVKDQGPLGFKHAADYIAQAAQGLAHAHAKGLVHRDVKPANLLLTEDNAVKILDLGLALFQEEDEESLTVLHNEKVMGTADYLSPEQAVNSHDVDLRADIYSLGCTLYFLLTGKPPFSEGSLVQRIVQHQSAEPKPVEQVRADCPRELAVICRKMMKKKPHERFSDCNALVLAIEQFIKGDPKPKKKEQRSETRAHQSSSVTLPEGKVESVAQSASGESDRLATKASGRLPTPARQVGGPDAITEKIKSNKAVMAKASASAKDSAVATEAPASAKTSTVSKTSTPARVSSASSRKSESATNMAPISGTRLPRTVPTRSRGKSSKGRSRRGKKMPVWLVPALIVTMLSVLIGVLVLVTQNLN